MLSSAIIWWHEYIYGLVDQKNNEKFLSRVKYKKLSNSTGISKATTKNTSEEIKEKT